MKSYTTDKIRNVVLIGASRSGKTSLSEAMLYEGKVIDRRGSVEEKNTVSDNTEFEQTNQKSINATPLYGDLQRLRFHLLGVCASVQRPQLRHAFQLPGIFQRLGSLCGGL